MQYDRGVKSVTLGILLLCSCSGKSETKPSPKPADASIDAASAPPPIDAALSRFLVNDKQSSFGRSIEIQPRTAHCPKLEWRPEPKTVAITKCKDQSLADQIPLLRDMVSFARGTDPTFDEVRIVGSVDFYSWPELGRRYIEYAKTHPWNRDKQSLNAWVVEAGQKGDMFPEYAAIFQRKPKLSSAEKCSAGRRTSSDAAGVFVRENGATTNVMIPLGCAMGVIELDR